MKVRSFGEERAKNRDFGLETGLFPFPKSALIF